MQSFRWLAILGLFAVLFGLCVGYGTLEPAPSANRFPTNSAVGTDAVAPGDRVVLSGIVHAVDADGVVLDLKGGPRIVVRSLGGNPDPGDDVWLYGVVDAGPTTQGAVGSVRVERAIVRPPWAITYLYAVSALGALLTLVRIVRTWRVDSDRWRIVAREDG
ncbi:MAG: hypothetical protein ABEJ73_09930 [Haloplanus sp.]